MKRLVLVMLCLLLGATTASAADGFRLLDRAVAQRLVDPAAYRSPTIVALWSTDCVHCKKNLRLLAELAAAGHDLNLVTVAVQPYSDDLAEPLLRLAVPGERYAYGHDAPEALAFALDPKWRGELPRTLLFDGRGHRIAISGVLDRDAVARALGR